MNRASVRSKRKAKFNHGSFSGDPETIWLTEAETDRRMCLLKPFWFRDPKKKEWFVPSEYAVDGASIPRALWTLVGSPYTGDYRRASIVHDKACDEAGGDTKARRAADRMFYHACRAGGCSIAESILLYIGVRIGAIATNLPAWQGAITLDREGPRQNRTASEDRLEADFRMAAKIVLLKGETDDPAVIERRTDEALSEVSGVDLRGK